MIYILKWLPRGEGSEGPVTGDRKLVGRLFSYPANGGPAGASEQGHVRLPATVLPCHGKGLLDDSSDSKRWCRGREIR